MGPIYKVKKQNADDAEAAFTDIKNEIGPLINEKESLKSELLINRGNEINNLEAIPLTGLASRLEALSRLTDSSSAVFFASIFLILLFIVIETAPLFVKLITNRSPYDFELDKIEVGFQTSHAVQTSIKKSDAKNAIEYELATKLHQNQQHINSENELYAEAIKSEVEEIKNSPSTLKEFLKKGRLIFSE